MYLCSRAHPIGSAKTISMDFFRRNLCHLYLINCQCRVCISAVSLLVGMRELERRKNLNKKGVCNLANVSQTPLNAARISHGNLSVAGFVIATEIWNKIKPGNILQLSPCESQCSSWRGEVVDDE